MQRTRRSLWGAFGAGALLVASSALAAPVELVGIGSLPGDASDGLTGLNPPVLEDGTPHDQLGAFGSAITYTGIGNRYLATPDRGPADGTTSFLDRFYLIDLAIAPGASPAVTARFVRATLLTNEAGENFTGHSTEFDATNSPASLRLDPEGVRVAPKGGFYVSDEYGPFLYEFNGAGDRLRALAVPPKFLIDHPNADGALELPPNNTKGRQSNRGMEGLASSPDGKKLFGLMQNALIQDGALNSSNQRRGVNNRILEIDTTSGATREFVYPIDIRNLGTNEILAIDDHEFLTIERDGNGGTDAAFKKIMKIDTTGATDVSNVTLPQTGLPPNVTAATKSVFIDLLDPAYGLAGVTFPEKIEGLAFGPDLPDGRHVLVVTNDNDLNKANPNEFFVFAIDPSALPGFQPQTLVEAIAVKPGDSPATINLKSKGVTPVAILSSGLFDAFGVDPASVRLAGAPPRKLGNGRPSCSFQDVNGDGVADLLCQVETTELSLQPGDTHVTLTAKTTTGIPVVGTEAVVVK